MEGWPFAPVQISQISFRRVRAGKCMTWHSAIALEHGWLPLKHLQRACLQKDMHLNRCKGKFLYNVISQRFGGGTGRWFSILQEFSLNKTSTERFLQVGWVDNLARVCR